MSKDGNSGLSNIHRFLSSIKVRDCGLTKVRIGGDGDGGYVLYDELCQRSPLVYSVGIGNNVDFEMDWVSKYPDTKFKMMDPFLKQLPVDNKRFSLQRYGLGSKWKPLKDVVKDSTLKMDIEWDEWGAISVFPEKELRAFSQLAIEFHIVHVEPIRELSPYFYQFYSTVFESVNEDLFGQYYEVMEILNNWFYIFHIHANNSLPPVNVDSYMFPPLLEISFIRKDLAGKNYMTKEKFPIAGLDKPNKTNRPDITDYYPFF